MAPKLPESSVLPFGQIQQQQGPTIRIPSKRYHLKYNTLVPITVGRMHRPSNSLTANTYSLPLPRRVPPRQSGTGVSSSG